MIRRNRPQRPARPPRYLSNGGTSNAGPHAHEFEGEHPHAEMGLPQMKLKTAIEAVVGLLAHKRTVVLACVPPESPTDPVAVDADEMAAAQIVPSLFGVTDLPDEKKLTTMLILRPVPGAPPQITHDAVLLLTLVPRVLKTLLTFVKPWHLALLAPELFPLPEKPSDEQLNEFSTRYAAALMHWGVFKRDEQETR